MDIKRIKQFIVKELEVHNNECSDSETGTPVRFTCVTGISASGKYFRKQVLLAKHFPWTSVYPKSAIPSLSAQRLRI